MMDICGKPESLIHCMLCCETIRQPQLLGNCQHVFCRPCWLSYRKLSLQAVIVDYNNHNDVADIMSDLLCPVCSSLVDIDDVRCGFPQQNLTDGLLKEVKLNLVSYGSEICKLCASKKKVENLCMDCLEDVCLVCTYQHQRQDHTIWKRMQCYVAQCHYHKMEVKQWCKTCNKLICDSCHAIYLTDRSSADSIRQKYNRKALTSSWAGRPPSRSGRQELSQSSKHSSMDDLKQHQVENLLDITDQQIRKLSQGIQDLESEIQGRKDLCQRIQDFRQMHLQQLQKTSAEIDKHAGHLVDQIEAQKTHLKEVLLRRHDQVSQLLEKQTNFVQNGIQSIKKLASLTQLLTMPGHEYQLLANYDEIRLRTYNLCQRKADSFLDEALQPTRTTMIFQPKDDLSLGSLTKHVLSLPEMPKVNSDSGIESPWTDFSDSVPRTDEDCVSGYVLIHGPEKAEESSRDELSPAQFSINTPEVSNIFLASDSSSSRHVSTSPLIKTPDEKKPFEKTSQSSSPLLSSMSHHEEVADVTVLAAESDGFEEKPVLLTSLQDDHNCASQTGKAICEGDSDNGNMPSDNNGMGSKSLDENNEIDGEHCENMNSDTTSISEPLNLTTESDISASDIESDNKSTSEQDKALEPELTLSAGSMSVASDQEGIYLPNTQQISEKSEAPDTGGVSESLESTSDMSEMSTDPSAPHEQDATGSTEQKPRTKSEKEGRLTPSRHSHDPTKPLVKWKAVVEGNPGAELELKPKGITFLPDGRLAVTYQNPGHIRVYDKEGKVCGSIAKATEAFQPADIAYAGNDKVIVTDCERQQLQVYKILAGDQGNLVSKQNPVVLPHAPDLFKGISGIAIDMELNRIIISDKIQNNVTILGIDGKVIKRFGGGRNRMNSLLDCPVFIAVDRVHRILVSDCLNHSVKVFDMNGDYLYELGTSETRIKLSHPSAIATDTHGNILVADSGNNRIVKYPPNSSERYKSEVLMTLEDDKVFWPHGLSVYKDRFIALTSRNDNVVTSFTLPKYL